MNNSMSQLLGPILVTGDHAKMATLGTDGRDIIEFVPLLGTRNWQIKINLH
ncbi:MAG: hypothetical protein ACKVOY_01450 [Burkholderiaceae bacterium]